MYEGVVIMIIVLTKVCLVMTGFLLGGSFIQWCCTKGKIKNQQYILDCAVFEMQQDQLRTQRQLALKEEEEKIQKSKVFYMNFKINHGSAFGGFSCLMNDGRNKKGYVPLDHILLYGRHPSGKEFTYYIEEQGIDICATDQPDALMVRSNGANFEIRQIGQNRDEGQIVDQAIIYKDIPYYIILESKHEIMIKATKGC